MCICHKFALTESVCWLTVRLREWRVEPISNPARHRRNGEDGSWTPGLSSRWVSLKC
ncbi:hypothetical protein BDN71DRAFT_1446153 [Pleurotus eryngii]|uniref:Uncharacterized protein n=1 Tax=Pleurotus eryngii TaxID=5323 RepID=A0A9P6DGB2_PLEER|nr:hypothetical protein BDN71DRAFT_1446153 [Pleurotus eryngii]